MIGFLLRIQLFLFNLVKSGLSLIKVLLLSNPFIKNPSDNKKSEDCIIIGNGPSVGSVLKNDIDFFTDKDVFCVNFFWKSEYYKIIKPNHYVIISESYFYPTKKTDINKKDREESFLKIAEKTNWDLILYTPSFTKKQKQWRKAFIGNKKIKFGYINLTPIEGFKSINYCLLKLKLGLPRPHNVIIPALKTAIDLGYKNIYLIGIDHSWLQEIYVSESNQVLLKQIHFYDKTAEPKKEPMYKGLEAKERNMVEVLTKFIHTFQSYYSLADYAVKRGVNVWNATKGSYVDAFKRFNI